MIPKVIKAEIAANKKIWLVCFSFSLPSWSKIDDEGTKQILRQAMRGLMPELVRTRKKKLGFVSPFSNWLQQGLHKKISNIVNDHSFQQTSLFDGKKTQLIFASAMKEKDWSRIHQLWPFIQAYFLDLVFKKKRSEHMKAHHNWSHYAY